MGARRGPLALVGADGEAPVSPGAALLEEMLAGWRRQQQARRLTVRLADERERVVRQFAAFTGCWPWQWTAAQAEAWVASGGWAHSTVRSYEGALALFLEYVCDPRYGWVSECEQRAGAVPVQVFHERNTAAHVCEHEGRAERRPLTRAELQAFFDAADDHVEKAAGSRRKGWLASFRDATLFKVIYGWGLRRREAAMLDVADFAPNPAAPELDEELHTRLPVIEGTVIEVRVERLPDGRSPHRAMWLWHYGPLPPDLDVCWRAYLRRFDMEHTFKLLKSQLGWTAARVRHPEQAVRWTWLLIAAYVQLRLARDLAADLRRPWERRPRPGRPLTPCRVRRAFRHLRDQLGTPARLPKTTRPGPGRPPGGKNTPAPRHRLGSELRKTDTPKKASDKKKG